MKQPGKYIILFDGVCNLCNRWVNIVLDHDIQDRFRFASLQSRAGKEIIRKFNISEKTDSIILVKGQDYRIKSDAALEIAKVLGGKFRLFQLLFIFPHSIRDYFYDVVARNRYKWFGKRNVCRMPSEGEKRKFLG